MLSRLKITEKVYFQGVVLFILLIIMGSVSLFQLQRIGKELFEIAEEDIPLTLMLTKATEHQLEQAIYLERAFFKAVLVKYDYPDAKYELEKNITKVSEYQKLVIEELEDARSFAQDAINKLHTEEAKSEYRNVINGLSSVLSELIKLRGMTEDVIRYAKLGKINDVIKRAKDIENIEDNIDKEG